MLEPMQSVTAPSWCTTKGMRWYWFNPEKVPLSRFKARRFKRRLWEHGRLSPNFTRREAASKDGVAIPRQLRGAAQRQAFHMERVRHQCGDKPLTVLSWYRSPSHNANVGGASKSQHVKARACDVDSNTINRIGENRWNRATGRVFSNGGIGFDNATQQNRHVDSRGGVARWTYN